MAFTSSSSVVPIESLRVSSSRPITLPDIPELHNPNFLDVLIPGSTDPTSFDEEARVPVEGNPFMDALKATANRTYTANDAQALKSTLSPVLDAFNGLTTYDSELEINQHLAASWAQDSQLTLRLIWNLRSIHDGVGEKELFYRAFGWLYDHHPRTAIANLHQLVVPVCVAGKKGPIRGKSTAHGYWKDLLNILALATCDELADLHPSFLHATRDKFTYGKHKRARKIGETPASRIEANEQASLKAKAAATTARRDQAAENHKRLIEKLAHPKFRALYIAVARLFADQLVKDIQVLSKIAALAPGEKGSTGLVKQLSLAGKWAPTPGRSHDRVTNISTAIAELIYSSQVFSNSYPSSLNSPLSAHERVAVLRSFYQRWVLTELRRVACYPEPLMSANRWKEIKYTRVSSIAMKMNTPNFFKHDPEGFEKYLISVEKNKKSISGATLMPHQLVAQAIKLSKPYTPRGSDKIQVALGEVRKKLAGMQLRVVEAQWKTLTGNLREAGTIENSLAICDVSGSMGTPYSPLYYYPNYSNEKRVQPILPAIALSLVLASLSKAPWNGGFVTFSAQPEFVAVDLAQPLVDQVRAVSSAPWGMNTNLQAVFLDLLLPLAVNNNIKQEDMVKRLFIFSDMQFDQSQSSGAFGNPRAARPSATTWETTYDRIEKAYKEAGYEVPQIVYWDLAAEKKTVEVEGDRKGVAMMNGFSPAMLKVFMGEQDEEEVSEGKEEMEWECVTENGESITVVGKPEEKAALDFTPINVMKKALMRSSYDGLVIFD